MALKKRKWQSGSSDDAVSIPPSKRLVEENIVTDSYEQQVIDAEISRINDLLQEEETSQKQTWQIGKRVKKLLESHENLPTSKQMDAYFLWGTALARLASLNEDTTLAEAAVDKFRHMQQLSENEVEEDAALGPVGFSLWGSSLLILATETQDRQVLNEALTKLQRAVQVDGGTTFETKFQYAKALKEGGDLVTFLDSKNGTQGKKSGGYYYDIALNICKELEEIYHKESEKQNVEEMNHDKEEDEDDDKVTVEDFAESKLLEAVLQGLLEDSSKVEDFYRTLTLYQEAIGDVFKCCIKYQALYPSSGEALMEMTNYLATRCLKRASLGTTMTFKEWAKLFHELEGQYQKLLIDVDFDLRKCHEICQRKDRHDQKEPEMEEIDERVPHLLNTLGKGLAAFVRSFPFVEDDASQMLNAQNNQRNRKTARNSRFARAVELLRCAHHFHDKLGSYHLACLFASPAFEDEEQCRIWLETADSYGSLEEEFDTQEFITMHEKPWFKRLSQPVELVEEIRGEE